MYAFQAPNTGYIQIDQVTGGVQLYDTKYHNVGQLMTPYEGKPGGTVGDYAPPQNTRYFTDNNSNYIYPLDSQSRPGVYIPMAGSESCGSPFGHPGFFETYEPQYPGTYVPSNYFAPQRVAPGIGHVLDPNHPEDYDPARGALGRPVNSPFLQQKEGYKKLAVTGIPLTRNRLYMRTRYPE